MIPMFCAVWIGQYSFLIVEINDIWQWGYSMAERLYNCGTRFVKRSTVFSQSKFTTWCSSGTQKSTMSLSIFNTAYGNYQSCFKVDSEEIKIHFFTVGLTVRKPPLDKIFNVNFCQNVHVAFIAWRIPQYGIVYSEWYHVIIICCKYSDRCCGLKSSLFLVGCWLYRRCGWHTTSTCSLEVLPDGSRSGQLFIVNFLTT